MKNLTELLTYRALHFKMGTLNDSLLEHVIEQDGEAMDKLQLKNVCAKLSAQLADRLDNTCNVLDISKRRFIEAAIIAALDEADRVMTEVDMFEHVEHREQKEGE